MFDEVKFTGTVNLGNIINALVVLIGSIGLYYRVKAQLAAHEKETGQKIETSIKKRFTRKKKAKVAGPGDQGDPPAD